MNIGQILLQLHILGAFGIGFLVLVAFISLVKNLSKVYKPLAVYIGIGTGIQLITGSLLALTIGNESLLMFCSKIGSYLGIVIVTEAFLLKNMYAKDQQFPIKIIASSLTLGMVFALFTLFRL